jgi:acyl dehydratase
MRTRYLEDFTVGETFRTAGFTFNAEEIIEFARLYDPQSFHIDPAAAQKGPFKGLVASGFHTVARQFRDWLDLGLLEKSSLGGPGIEELRWIAPVRPGDTVTTEVQILKVRKTRSRPDRGVLHYRMIGYNQRGEAVISMLNVTFVRRREALDEDNSGG